MPELETTPSSNDNPLGKHDGLVFDVDDDFSYDGDTDFVLDEDGNWIENNASSPEVVTDQQTNSDNKFVENSKEESGPVEKFELSGLNDDEYLNISQTFASEYKGLVNGQVETEFQKQVSEKVGKEIAPIIEKIEHLRRSGE